MADDGESPRPFRRERNLSNRNFARHSARRRFSTDSHSSVDSFSTSQNQSQAIASESTPSSSSSSTSTTASAAASASSSLQISYSVNSDTENAFNRKSLLKMKPLATAETGDGGPPTSDPAMLGVKQKVQRFEILQAQKRISLKMKSQLKMKLTAPSNAGAQCSPLRVLPTLLRRQQLPADDIDGERADVTGSSMSASFHTSIDEVRSEDEVDDLSDFAENDGNSYDLPEEAHELTESVTPSPLPGYEDRYQQSPSSSLLRGDVVEYGVDDFGKVESLRRTISNNSASSSVTSGGGGGAGDASELSSNHSSEQNAAKNNAKDFPRNYSKPPSRRKTEIIGIKNRPVIGKHTSLYENKENKAESDETAEDEEEIVMRDKCDKFVHPILEELIKTEETYVDSLFQGLENYGKIFNRKDLPIGLRSKKYVLLGNIEQLAEFHRDEFLPMLHRNRRDLKRLFDDFQQFIEENCFYGYVIYTMNKQRSLKLCEVYKNYFKLIQAELDDKLGINSFLVQPIQRMARYPLLLDQFIKTLFKNGGFEMKPLIDSCCRLEKKFRTLLNTTNESETINDIVDCNEFNVFHQGKFRKVSEFSVVDHNLRRTYRSKVFIFDKCIIYTEIKGGKLVFHGRYPCEHIGIVAKTKSFTLFYEKRPQQECDFVGDPVLVAAWLLLIAEMINSYVREEQLKLKERYSSETYNLHPKPPSLALFRDSNRFSSDSGIGNIWVMPKPEHEEPAGTRSTWYADHN